MDSSSTLSGWQFVDAEATFRLAQPHDISYLYFPLVSEAGMMSAITPTFNGDIKTDQNTFLTLPVSVEDLHNTRSARNFWVVVDGYGPWSVTGNGAGQIARRFTDEDVEQVVLEAGFLWHKITRTNPEIGLRVEITSFVPANADRVELMQVTLTNISDQSLKFTPTAAIPIYGRSADNLRDHRHVTSLLHRIRCHRHGVLVRPTLSFDEHGHTPNAVTYAVLGATDAGNPPDGFFPVIEEFIGEGGTLDWPEAVVKSVSPIFEAGDTVDGYEAVGGLRFSDVLLSPGESQSYVLLLAIVALDDEVDELVNVYGTGAGFDTWLRRTRAYWADRLDTLTFHTGDPRFDLWMRWVAVQPTLRRLFGNSFLPYHDYGRGGRGWRDLWQDVLALLITEAGDVSDMLLGNFAGVRIDGSNATIIGSEPGEFRADRNNIPRVWMDHGAWPWLTTRLYIDQTADLAFLLREQTYFKDHLIYRSRAVDEAWEPEQGMLLRTTAGEAYRGTVLEHLLIQHLTPFLNVGEHNNIRLEDADWNAGLDMAPNRGESVAFTALYASNLRQLSEVVPLLEQLGVTRVELAVELMPLLDTLTEPVDYASVEAKQRRLAAYFESCRHTISGKKTHVMLGDLANDLVTKADWLFDHIRANEWIRNADGYGWFNGYYDDDGRRVGGDHSAGVRMTLSGQVFTLMGGIATDEQAQGIVQAADRYLFDPQVGGYRLNTDFCAVLPDASASLSTRLGRCFGFAFGHKENGAMFSHMAVMYAHALYQQGFVHEGYRVLAGIFQHSQDFAVSRMYPGIPEYVSAKGRGMYPYLTGSASWYLLTLVTQVFGVRGALGDLVLLPKLVRTQFDLAGIARINTLFAGKKLEVIYHNPARLDYGEYQIERIEINGQAVGFRWSDNSATLARSVIATLNEQQRHRVDVWLA